ncbi:MAG: family 16 glycoside hydrolase [Acidimicrobiia bacterium]
MTGIHGPPRPPEATGRLMRCALRVLVTVGLVAAACVEAPPPDTPGSDPLPPTSSSSPPRGSAEPEPTESGPWSAALDPDYYLEDFEDGWADDWVLPSTFVVENDSLSAGGPGRARYRFGDYWRDSTLRLRVLLLAGEARIHYRAHWFGYADGHEVRAYEVALTGDQLQLRRLEASPDGRSAEVLASAPLARSADWRVLEVTGKGPRLTVTVDGQTLIEHSDPAPDARLEGSIGLDLPEGGQALFDDVEVTALLHPEQTWTRTNGPEGAMVTTIVVDPTDPSNVYAGTGHSGLYVSRDRGVNWEQLGHAGGLIKNKVSWVEIAPSDGRVLYLGHLEDGGGSRSSDGGEHWSAMRPGGSGHVNAFAVHPQDSHTAYVAIGSSEAPQHSNAEDGVYLTIDDGATWEQLSLGNRSVFAVRIAASQPHVVYAGGAGGVWRSDDAGATWAEASGGLGDVLIKVLIVDPVDPLVVYAREHYWGGPLFKTTDGGRNWGPILDGVEGVVMSPADRLVLYASSFGSIQRTRDGGAHWEEISDLPGSVDALAIDPEDPDRIYAGLRGEGILISTDGGRSWAQPHMHFVGDLSTAVAVHPGDPEIVYVGHGHGYVSSTTDGGDTWSVLTRLGVGGSPDEITDIAIRPDRPDTVFVSNLTGVYRSTDAGQSWELSSVGMDDRQIISLAIDPDDPDRMYAGTGSSRFYYVYHGTGLYRSTDGGASWLHVDGLPDAPIPSISLSAADPRVIYLAVMGHGVYRSVDGGLSWAASAPLDNPYVYVVAAHPTDPNVVYAGTLSFYGRGDWDETDGLYRSDDGGESWRRLRRDVWIENLIIDPTRPEHVYFTEHSESIWHSPDGGQSWELATKGLVAWRAHLYTYAMAMDPQGTVLYMVNCGMGMYSNFVGEVER